jgi:hypothetical protein
MQVMVDEAIRPLREEAMSCRVCLERVVGSDPAPRVDFVDEGKTYMYGCFSPRASLSTSSLPAASMSEVAEVASPVLQIMPELQELCGDSLVVPPLEMGSLEALAVTTTPSPPSSEPCQSLAYVGCEGLDTSSEACVLAPNSEALFRKELCNLLVSLEAASPGYGMEIVSILAKNASEDVIRKVEKSLRSKRKKRVITWKFSTAA